MTNGKLYERALMTSMDTTGNGIWNVTNKLTIEATGLKGYECAIVRFFAHAALPAHLTTSITAERELEICSIRLPKSGRILGA